MKGTILKGIYILMQIQNCRDCKELVGAGVMGGEMNIKRRFVEQLDYAGWMLLYCDNEGWCKLRHFSDSGLSMACWW